MSSSPFYYDAKHLIRYFWVTVYKDDDGFYPQGLSRQISCNHQREVDCGITTKGIIVPVPSATLPPGHNPGTSAQTESVLVSQNTVFNSPTQFADATYKAVTRIKDFTNNNVTSWVDTAEYNANVIACNPSTHN